jgi:hypothetical protein
MLEYVPLLNIRLPSITFDIFLGFTVSEFDFLPFDTLFESLNIVDDSTGFTQNFIDFGKDSIYLLSSIPDIVALIILFTLATLLLFALEKLILKCGNIFGERFSNFILD